MSKNNIRTICIVLFLVVTIFYLSPLFLPKEIDAEGNATVVKPIKFWTGKMLKLGLDLRGGMEINLYVDLSELQNSEHDEAVKAAVRVIQNRIDQFGVAEPSIQRIGDNKVVVQLPGLTDFQRAKDLIGRTALLEFKLVANHDEVNRAVNSLDTWLSHNHHRFEYLKVLDFRNEDDNDTFAEQEENEDEYSARWYDDILSFIIGSGTPTGGANFAVRREYQNIFRQLISEEDFANQTPGLEFVLGRENKGVGRGDLDVFVLQSRAELRGNNLTNAETRFGGQGDFANANKPYISLRFNRDGSRIFERITGQFIGRQLAIVLDNVVYVAPTIQDRIRGGEAQITGNFTLEEANDIVIVLKAGNLPAPVSIGEERTVGPSLGSDSIRQGTRAGVIGILLIMLFMVVYYKLAGMIANFALILNTSFVFAALTFFEATLTLPGIAGIILTIGFAVDANVLIFERIKEELRTGKSIRNAVDAGYNRAIITILDANITSLIVAAVLYQFGSGSIRGFAVTLSIGILASMFTAIVLTRYIYDNFITSRNITKLSI